MPSQAAANLQALLESTDDPIWSVDRQGRLIAFNAALRTDILQRFQTEPAIGMCLHSLFPPEKAPLWEGFYRRALVEGPFESEYTTLSGNVFAFRFSPIVRGKRRIGVAIFGRDITSHKHDEETLRHLAATVESSQDAFITHTPQGSILSWNRAAERIFGYAASEAIGQPITLLMPPDRRKIAHAYYSDILAGRSRDETLGYGVHRNGSRIQVLVSSWPIRNADGEIVAISNTIRDMTGRREAEQAKAFLAAIVESSDDAIYGEDLDGKILSWNASAERLFGYTRQQAVGKNVVSLIVDRDEKQVHETLETIRQGNRVPPYDARIRHKDGKILDVSLTVSPVRDTTGRIVSAAGIARDIGPRKRLERALIEAERKYRAIFNGALEGIFQIAIDDRTYTVNAAVARMLGYESIEELLGKIKREGSRIWVDRKERRRFQRTVLAAGGQAILGFESRLRRKDGSIIWAALNARAILDEHGHTRYVEGFIEDITARKLAQQAVADSEARFRSLFEDSGTIMLVIEPDSGEIKDANRAAAAFYGYPREQLLGANISLLNTLPLSKIKKERARTLREGLKYISFRHRLASGEIRDVQVYSSPVSIAGQTLLYSMIFDVTQQKLAECKLRETTEKLIAAQRLGGLGNYEINLSDGTWHSSQVLNEILGIGPDYPRCLNSWQELLHPDDRSEFVRNLHEEVIGKGLPLDKEYRIVRHSDGAERWVHGTGKVIFNDAGIPCRLHGTLKDITTRKQAELALRSSEIRYRTAFQMSIDAMVLSRVRDGILIDVNNTFCQTTGYSRDEALGKNSAELNFWTDPEDHQKIRRALIEEGSCQNYQCQFRKKDGSLVWGMISVSLLEVEGELCALSITRDITQAKQIEMNLVTAQRALRSSEERYRTVFQASLDCISISKLSDGAIIDVNHSYFDLLGYRLDEILGRTCLELGFWAEPAIRARMADVLRKNGSFRDIRTQFRKKSGELIWVLISASTIEIEGEPCVLTIVRDISDAKAAEDKIWNLAFYDSLTRLPNRRLLMDRLRQMLAATSRSVRMRALLFIDLDNFKTLNDSLGHQNGDELLREVAQRLIACVRGSDTVARQGGDEFVILLDNLNYYPEHAAAQVEAIAQKILKTLEIPFSLGGREYFTTASIGITLFGSKTESANELLQQADIAMYQAKAAGRNTLRFFEPALQTAVQERATLGDEMRLAVRTGQFVLFLQPLIGLQGLLGAEALVRWQHPQRGLLAPGNFIPLAEELGLILPLGELVLEAACQRIAAWERRQPPTSARMAVNISARQFYQPGFVHQILSILKRTGANPTRLTLEITESILLDNIEEAIQKMQHLKECGVRFSLDDFGTGYSSLSYLKRLPFNQLKIDQSFVRDLLDDLGSRAIAQTVISLGQALQLDVIAEGVETAEQRDLLQQMGCHSFQGYFFGRPIPLEDFEKTWLSAHPVTEAATSSEPHE